MADPSLIPSIIYEANKVIAAARNDLMIHLEEHVALSVKKWEEKLENFKIILQEYGNVISIVPKALDFIKNLNQILTNFHIELVQRRLEQIEADQEKLGKLLTDYSKLILLKKTLIKVLWLEGASPAIKGRFHRSSMMTFLLSNEEEVAKKMILELKEIERREGDEEQSRRKFSSRITDVLRHRLFISKARRSQSDPSPVHVWKHITLRLDECLRTIMNALYFSEMRVPISSQFDFSVFLNRDTNPEWIIRNISYWLELEMIGIEECVAYSSSFLRGREREELEVNVNLLRGHEERLGVVAITGRDGIGKTTLARHVFNNKLRGASFELRAWVTASRDHDVLSIVRTLFEEITGECCNLSNKHTVQRKLSHALKDVKFFIVFDDLWCDRKPHWDFLVAPLMAGAEGSRVIVTTSHEIVADVVGSAAQALRPLALHVFRSVFNEKHLPMLKEKEEPSIIDQIIVICNGVPLVGKILVEALRHNHDLEFWKDFVAKNWLCSDGVNVDIVSILRFIYNDLPAPLKPCFEVLAIFPENHRFDEGTLVNLWLSEDLILWKDTKINSFRRGRSHPYVEELSARFLILKDEEEDRFFLHNVVRDFLCEVSGGFFLGIRSVHFQARENFETTVRHLYLERSETLNDLCPRLKHTEDLRTLIVRDGGISHEIVELLFRKVRDIRTLKMSEITVPEFVKNAGNFTYLRHLSLVHSVVNFEWLNLLCNLEILELIDCDITPLSLDLKKLKKLKHLSLDKNEILCLPANIGDLENLKDLCLNETKISSLPESVSSLVDLESLKLGMCKGITALPENIGDLQMLKVLGLGGTRITKLPASIVGLFRLKILRLGMCSELTDLPAGIGSLTSLQELQLGFTGISSLPNSIVFLGCLEIFSLTGCKRLTSLPAMFGNLTNLRLLELDFSGVSNLPHSIVKLDQLKTLRLEGCFNIKNLPDDIEMFIKKFQC